MHQSFIGRIVAEVSSRNKTLDNTTFVVPSRRSGTFLKHTIAKHTTATILAPEILSIEQFVEELSGISYATNTELLFTLYESYLDIEVSDHETFADFSKWATTLIADFDEIDRYLIVHEKVFSYLSDITEIQHWYLSKDKTPLMENYIAFWNSLGPMYKVFREKLLSRDKGHQGLVYRKAYENLETFLKSNEKQYIFLGFNALNEAESRIIQAFLSETNSSIYWDIDKYFIESGYHDAGYFIRQHIKTWPYYRKHNFPVKDESFLSPKEIHITGVPKNVAQAKYVGQLLEQLANSDPTKLENTAVVLGDETMLNPLLNSLPTSINEVNITMGYPLRHTPLAGLYEQFFSLHMQSFKRGWPYKQVLSFLSLPQIRLLMSRAEMESLEQLQTEIQRRNLVFVSGERLKTCLGDLGVLIFDRNNEKVEHFLRSAQQLVELMKNASANDLQVIEEEHLFGFFNIFNQLSEMTMAFPYVTDLNTLHTLYLELIAEQTIDFQGEPLKGLQIMGMLESRALDFDTVIITSVNEGILPAGKQFNSFIPFDVKKELGLPTYIEKDAVYTYHFYRLLQRARKVYIIYNTEPDVLVGGEPSRFIHQLCTDTGTSNMTEHNIATMAMKSYDPVPLIVRKDAELLNAISNYAQKGFSPSSLVQYIRDPIEFYKKFILGIEDSQMVEESIEASTFGTIIHNSLEDLLKPFEGNFLDPELLKSAKKEVESCVKRHFTAFYDQSSIKYGKNSIAFQVLIRNIMNYLDYEIDELQTKEIKLLGIEKKLEMELAIPGFTFPVKLKGKLDRIDECNGELRIIDYKTGKVETRDMNIVDWADIISKPDRSKAFQVLCYALMYRDWSKKDLMEAGIISFKNLKAGYIEFAQKDSINSRKRHTAINSEVLDQFEDCLHQLIREICDPEIPFTEATE